LRAGSPDQFTAPRRFGQDEERDATTLRELQSPLKDMYRADAEAAHIPTAAHGEYEFATGRITATIDGFAGPVRAGLHPAAAGSELDACSADLLLQAVLGCAGVTFRSVATAMGVEIRDAKLSAAGWWDARGTLGVDRDVPVGVQDIVVTIAVDTDADEERLARMARTTEKYCVVAQTLAVTPSFEVVRL